MFNRNLESVGSWSLVTGLAVAAVWFAPNRAEACGASPPTVYTVTSVSPAWGALGVARDAGIIVSGSAAPLGGGPTLLANVSLFDADGGAVPLRESIWFSLDGSTPAMAVHPAEPLLPLRAYHVEARTVDPNTNEPSAAFVSEFTTSEALLEPLVLSGDLGLTVRGGEADILDHGICGGFTRITGKRRALYADVQLPVPSGGQGIYRGSLHFADNTPPRPHPLSPFDYDPSDGHEVRDWQTFGLDAGEALSLSQEVVDSEKAYAGCFTLVVSDPAGNTAQTSACLPVLAPDTIRTLALDDASLDLAADEASAADQVESALDARRERGPVWSCAVATGQPLPVSGWLALLVSAYLGRRLVPTRAKGSSEPKPQR